LQGFAYITRGNEHQLLKNFKQPFKIALFALWLGGVFRKSEAFHDGIASITKIGVKLFGVTINSSLISNSSIFRDFDDCLQNSAI
jgi:hypothetical protein